MSIAITSHSTLTARPLTACTRIHRRAAIAAFAKTSCQKPAGMLKWSSEDGANWNAIPNAISTWPECQIRRWPSSLSSTWRMWTTMIATNTSVQITASQSGRMLVVPCAALIDMPPIDVV